MNFEDKDLEFLAKCSDEDLDMLYYILTHDREGNLLNHIKKLTKSPAYKKHFPQHSFYAEDFAQELAYYGSSSRLTKHSYKDLLFLLCGTLNINYNFKASAKSIESNFLMQSFSQILEKLSFQDIKLLDENLLKLKIKDEALLIDNFEALFFGDNLSSYLMKTFVVNAFLRALFKRELINSDNENVKEIKLLLQAPVSSLLSGEWSKLYYKDNFGQILNDAYKVSQLASVFYLSYLRIKEESKVLENFQNKMEVLSLEEIF